MDVGRGCGHHHPHGGVPAPVRSIVPPDPLEARRPQSDRQREEHGQQVFRVGGPGRPPPRRPQHRAPIKVRRLRGGAQHGRHRVPRHHRGHRALRGPERGAGQRLRLRGRRRLPSPPDRAPRPTTRQPAPADRRGEEALYVLVKNLSRLITQRSGHHPKSFPCVYCLHVFCRADLLADHIPHCKPHGPQRVKMPNGDDTTIFFKHEDRQLRVPFIVYADFECFTEKLATCIPNTASFTHRYQQHTPSATASTW